MFQPTLNLPLRQPIPPIPQHILLPTNPLLLPFRTLQRFEYILQIHLPLIKTPQNPFSQRTIFDVGVVWSAGGKSRERGTEEDHVDECFV